MLRLAEPCIRGPDALMSGVVPPHVRSQHLLLAGALFLVHASCKLSPPGPAEGAAPAIGPVSASEARYLDAAPSFFAAQPGDLLKSAMHRYRSSVDLRAVEQDLPADIWIDGGKSRYNSTRATRESDAAEVVLRPVRHGLATFPPGVLARSLVLFEGPAGDCHGDCPGVSYYVYRNGNQLLAKELRRRGEDGARAVDALPPRAGIFTGYSGPSVSANDLARIIRDPRWGDDPPF